MTQKELSYVEDAICHESSIIEILNQSIANIEDENLSKYLEGEVSIHQTLKGKLLSKLEEETNG